MSNTITFAGNHIVSSVTSHSARCTDDGWTVTFLSGHWSRAQVISAMSLAETFHRLRAMNTGIEELKTSRDPVWSYWQAQAGELGMTGETVWQLLADTYPAADRDDQAPAADVTAVGAFHSSCCDAPVVTTSNQNWHCHECGAPDRDPAERAPAEQHHTDWCAEEHDVAEDCRTDWEGHEDDDTTALVRMLGNDDDQKRRYELHVTGKDGNHVTVSLTPRQARRIVAAFDLD